MSIHLQLKLTVAAAAAAAAAADATVSTVDFYLIAFSAAAAGPLVLNCPRTKRCLRAFKVDQALYHVLRRRER